MEMDGEIYLENIEEFLFDESRIVTYRWLSLTLGVHVNIAKQMLYHFVVKRKEMKEAKKINVTYILSGWKSIADKTKGMSVLLVKESELDKAKSLFDRLLSCHIYSVQLASVQDPSVLNMIDYDIINNNLKNSQKFSAITCTFVAERTAKPSLNLPPVKDTASAKHVKTPAENANQKESSSSTSAKSKAKPAGIAGMFAKAASKKSPEKTSEQEKTKTQGKTSTSSNQQKKTKTKGIAQMFANQASAPKKEFSTKAKAAGKENNDMDVVNVEQVEEEPKSQEIQREDPGPPAPPARESPEILQSNKRKEVRKPNSQKRKSSSKTSSKAQTEKNAPKRRRIKVLSDSEDEEDGSAPESPVPEPMEEEEEEEEAAPVITTTPVGESKDEKHTASTPGGHTAKRKRQKKVVSKKFLDDDGFMVTEMVQESCSESASEGEDVVPPTPEPVQKKKEDIKQKLSPSKKTHQASLTNFFRKK